MRRLVLVILIFQSLTLKVFATAQYGDKLVIEKDTFWINSNPLEPYFDTKGNRNIGTEEMQGTCTALWRGYVATWKLEYDSLFLTRIQTNYCGNNPVDIDIREEFGSKRVFAGWASGTIVRAKGALLQYVHMGYMSIYEQEIFYTLDKGLLSSKETKDYLERNKDYIFPDVDYLSDTIKSIILKSLDKTEREKFVIETFCYIQIEFNKNRQISEIRL